MRLALCSTSASLALFLFGCGSSSHTENTGVPIELNKSKNAPGSYGDPGAGAPTAPPKK